jgi:hypothetical protein
MAFDPVPGDTPSSVTQRASKVRHLGGDAADRLRLGCWQVLRLAAAWAADGWQRLRDVIAQRGLADAPAPSAPR